MLNRLVDTWPRKRWQRYDNKNVFAVEMVGIVRGKKVKWRELREATNFMSDPNDLVCFLSYAWHLCLNRCKSKSSLHHCPTKTRLRVKFGIRCWELCLKLRYSLNCGFWNLIYFNTSFYIFKNEFKISRIIIHNDRFAKYGSIVHEN